MAKTWWKKQMRKIKSKWELKTEKKMPSRERCLVKIELFLAKAEELKNLLIDIDFKGDRVFELHNIGSSSLASYIALERNFINT